MKLTSTIRKSLGDEAADDFEILLSENLLTKPEFNERAAQFESLIQAVRLELTEKIFSSQRTILLWMLAILISMWASLVFFIVQFR